MNKYIICKQLFEFKRIIIFPVLFCYFQCCAVDNADQAVQEILLLEWKRNITPQIFESYLDHKSEDVRLQVAESIAKIQSNTHIPALRKLLNDPSTKVVKKVIFALGQIADQEAIDILKDLLTDIKYTLHRREIIQALGRSDDRSLIRFLKSSLTSLEDSLVADALNSITFLTTRTKQVTESILSINPYLQSNDAKIKTAAIYYFSRNSDYSSINTIIKIPFIRISIGYKYKLKALDRSFASYGVASVDITVIDSFKIDLLYNLDKKDVPWQTKIYLVSLLSYFPDSLVTKKLSEFIRDENPHIRLKSIQALERIKGPEVKTILLDYYDEANWSEKGAIIFVLADRDRNLAHHLVQQNLDQGTLHFKQLLLRSLARINDSAAIRQLQQFLHVPSVRLKHTAFLELAQMKRISYQDAKLLLESGDESLVTSAVAWIVDHAQVSNVDDLINAYGKFSEPKDIAVMLAILEAIDTLNDKQSIEFLHSVYNRTSSKKLSDQVTKTLSKFNIEEIEPRSLRDSLFIPENIKFEKGVIQVVMKTEKGNITLELWPQVAPLTVTNFVNLCQHGFYNNLTFYRIVSDFVIQGGDPRGDGWGGTGYNIPCEYNESPFVQGSLGMARAGKDTGSSQFFICHSEQPHLNGRYTLFGKVIDGNDVVDSIEIDDKIVQISIKERGAL